MIELLDNAMKKLFESGGDDRSDSLTVLVYSDDTLEFIIDSPWHGSSETGFGADLEYTVTRDEAIALRDALTAWIDGNLTVSVDNSRQK
jgi:hypothetical protein